MIKKLLVLSSLLLFFIACQRNEASPVIGKWEAIALTEEAIPLEVDLSKIQFDFRPNGRYDFRSTLKYHEAGIYKTQSNYLFTTDTLNANAIEKMVKFEAIQNDTLLLIMKKENKERKITLIRK
ncbi:MAG TPA: hypothetical protein ENK52_06970 [Saprospiraceae bacterium]|nr:hypothetical protein [Saprospiraceae bacterium]